MHSLKKYAIYDNIIQNYGVQVINNVKKVEEQLCERYVDGERMVELEIDNMK